MQLTTTETKVKVTGNKRQGLVITISDAAGFKEDMPLTYEEGKLLRDLLIKKIK